MEPVHRDLLVFLFFLLIGLAFVARAMGEATIIGKSASHFWARVFAGGAFLAGVLTYWDVKVPVSWVPLDHQAFIVTAALGVVAAVIYGIRQLQHDDGD